MGVPASEETLKKASGGMTVIQTKKSGIFLKRPFQPYAPGALRQFHHLARGHQTRESQNRACQRNASGSSLIDDSEFL
jgi:hypothetical protein